MKFPFKIAASVIAASILAACSGGSQSPLPLVSAAAQHQRTVQANSGCGSVIVNGTVMYDGGACLPSDPSFNNCVIGCNPSGSSSYAPGVGRGGGGGCLRDPSNCVGVLPNDPGTHCHDSVSGAAENVPTNTSDSGHQVKEIDTVSATISVVGGYGSTATGPMGYIYVDNNGQWYLGESPSYTGNLWQVLGSQFGFIGQFLTGEHDYGKNFDQPITPAQVQQMKGLHNGQTIGVSPCVVPKSNA